jgi:DNA-binding MarR family transcriptional regulator
VSRAGRRYIPGRLRRAVQVEVEGDMSAEESVRLLESALSIIVAWALRHDIHEETMRRAKCDLPRAQTSLLTRLSSCGPLRIGELAVMLGVDNSTITPQAQRLERDGLIVREADPTDRRAAVLRITSAGRELLRRLHRSRRDILLERLGDWPEHDRAAAAAALSRLARAL